MIPLRLEVRNFLCYREEAPVLDFSGIHLACLCGPNGHGKSALLDAITWCVWGKARGKSQDELVSYGADGCWVQLDFSSRDETYRVIRSHSVGGGRRRQGVTDLQVQLVGLGGPVAVTGNSIRESQAKIEQIVGMDYDTFINSAFLLQGRADEFTNKPPAERKAVLARILGLETYDGLQDRAKERLTAVSGEGLELEGRLAERRRQLEAIGDPGPELEKLDLELSRLAVDLERERTEGDRIRREVAQLETRQRQLSVTESRIGELRRDLERLSLEEGACQARVERFQETLKQAESIREGVAKLTDARARLDRMEQAWAAYNGLDKERTRVRSEVNDARTRLEVQLLELKKRVEDELPSLTRREPELRLRMEELEKREVGLALGRESLVQLRDQAHDRATELGQAKSASSRYEEEGRELNSKLALLGNGESEGAVCPLCLTPLDRDSCGRLAQSYQSQVEEKRELYRQNRSRLQQLEKEIGDIEGTAADKNRELETEQRRLDSGRQEVERLVQESRQAQVELDQLAPRLASLGRSLESGDYAAEQHKTLARLEDEIRLLGYDEDTRSELYRQTREFGHFEEGARQLDHAMEELPVEEESLARIRQSCEWNREELERLVEVHSCEVEALAGLPGLEVKLEDSDRAVAGLESRREAALARKGFQDGQMARRRQLLEEVEQDSIRRVELEEEHGLCQELVNAFGRQGVQAMLIETVVPELEEQTNLLLGRMTDNRMHINLETQRERRTGRGDPIETLEIKVNDELGPRSYELFSGGEAFRVNLALRIALSKVLAQRVGSPLPTLFIDEGFGTQDVAGRERILDVIGAIQGDFEKIIVITHLDDIREAFPVRIEVQKGLDGSTFWVN